LKGNSAAFINFVTVSTSAYIVLSLIFGIENYHALSIISQFFGFIFLLIFTRDDLNSVKAGNPEIDHDLSNGLKIGATAIVLVNAGLGVLNLIYLGSKLMFEQIRRIDQESIFLYSGIVGILLAQTVGCIFQAFIVKLFATFVGAEGKLMLYINLTGYSYVGFLMLSFYTLTLNVFTVTEALTLIEFNEIMSTSWSHLLPSKIAEIVVIGILAYEVSRFEKIPTWKCILIAAVPSALLGFSYLATKLLV
jgi:hypothetical protein